MHGVTAWAYYIVKQAREEFIKTWKYSVTF